MDEKYDLYQLGLSPRAYNCLRWGQIFTIEQLLKTNLIDLRRIRNMGDKTIAEIRRAVDDYISRGQAALEKSPQGKPLSQYEQGAKDMQLMIVIRLKQMAQSHKGAQGAAIAAASRMVELMGVSGMKITDQRSDK